MSSGPGELASSRARDDEFDRAFELDRIVGEERRAAIARLASTLSHALGTPLNVIAGRAAMLRMRDLTPEQLDDNARIIGEQVRSITDLLNNVLAFVREGWPGPLPTRLATLARRVAALLQPLAQARGVRFELGSLEELDARVHASRIEQVLVNLLTHAMAAVGDGGHVSLSLRAAELEPPPYERGRAVAGPCARFDVTLHNVTLSAPDYERVYEPWLQPPPPGTDARVLAMLYAVSFGIAREHRAWVEFAPGQGAGSVFSLCWPLGGAG